MSMQKTVDATRYKSILAASGLSGLTVTDVVVTQAGSVTSIEIVTAQGSKWIKEKQGIVEVGGTIEWNTGSIAF
jgi:outer membrane biosynthesis protein TonB